jgi:hypothetical protein
MTASSTLLMERPAEQPALPHYQLRAKRRGTQEPEFEVWQLPAPATPHLREPKRVAGLGGRNLALVEYWLLKHLRRNGIDPTGLLPNGQQRYDLSEDDALHLGLLFRVLAPMRNRNYMRSCLEGIDAMAKEEAAYWLGMAIHRKHPRRVLMALRFLLIDPKQQ